MSAVHAPAKFLISGIVASFTVLGLHFPLHASEPKSCATELRARARSVGLAGHPQWLRLLHYRRQFPFKGSEADGPGFFASPRGAHDPAAELDAEIEALCSGEPRDTGDAHEPRLPLRCQFPLRTSFLKRELGTTADAWPEPACPALEEWRDRMRAHSLTMVFAAYHPGNPSSVFGHTLLRLNRRSTKGEPVVSPLLSYGVNFSATADTGNALKYALYGMAGGFKGEFSALPYYYKVREYSDLESRDLWEYDLKLTPNEVSNFVDHVWELGFTWFNYYYLTENCAYHLLTALEGAVPRVDASAHVPYYVIPIDSVRAAVKAPDLVGEIRFQPSLYQQFTRHERDLVRRPGARAYFERMAYHRDLSVPADLTPEDRARATDAALDYWDFRHFRELVAEKSDAQSFKHKLLVQRAALPTLPPPLVEYEANQRPDRGHGSMRYGLGAGHARRDYGFADLDLRFALHDILDPLAGYLPTTTTEFLHFHGRAFDHGRKFRLDDARVINVEFLAPVSWIKWPWSWHVTLGGSRVRGPGCRDCFAPLAAYQGGFAFEFGRRHVLTYGLIGARAQWVITPQANVGVRFRFSDRWLALIDGEWSRALGPGQRDQAQLTAETRLGLSSAWAAGLKVSDDRQDDQQIIFSLYHYR